MKGCFVRFAVFLSLVLFMMVSNVLWNNITENPGAFFMGLIAMGFSVYIVFSIFPDRKDK